MIALVVFLSLILAPKTFAGDTNNKNPIILSDGQSNRSTDSVATTQSDSLDEISPPSQHEDVTQGDIETITDPPVPESGLFSHDSPELICAPTMAYYFSPEQWRGTPYLMIILTFSAAFSVAAFALIRYFTRAKRYLWKYYRDTPVGRRPRIQ